MKDLRIIVSLSEVESAWQKNVSDPFFFKNSV